MPATLALFVVAGALAVVFLPDAADDLPHPGRDEQARYALTALGVAGVTGAFVYRSAVVRSAERAWLPAVAYGSALAVVKFILSPTAFSESEGVSLGEFVASGLAVGPVYLGVIAILHSIVARRSEGWPLRSKLSLAVLLGIVAVATRYAVSLVLGTASEYVRSLAGPGLVLPFVAALAALAVIEAFDRSRPETRSAFGEAVAVVLVQHALWVVYMYRLF